ncbi:MAG: Phosphoenolpyruvate synthase [uncultured Rubrobacteraceae bacterium]|uniref:Phosphoenolpyruvate synthase n=1 Tax=uncultured Rubrobacteraceae bacterium TaxID=349277 RepID=A0A6J4QKI5_9ACTN|nr:MAG: Phosphoenolpyruvate synthase [uncultured Rubrobacteraceae bacterium]
MQQQGLIPTPPDFPVVWENPDDERLFWTRDAMHFPAPVNELENEFLTRLAQENGFARACEAYDLPFRIRPRRINYYLYTAVAPVVASPEEMEAMGERSRERLGDAMARLGERWSGEFLPEIQQYLEDWDRFDLPNASMPELLTHLDETVAKFRRLWEIHFNIALPMMMSMSMFEEFYRDLFGSDEAFDAYRLLQGFDNKTVETGRELWRLSRHALEVPEVRKVLEENAAADAMPTLRGSAEGQRFLAEFEAYLDEYGQRGDLWGISYPTWAENPTPVIKMLKDYVSQTGGGPDEEQASLAAERERLLAETRERLAGYPQAVREEFEFLLKVARKGVVLSEDHGFWIDFNSTARVRRVIMEFGARFAEAGVIEGTDDVFHLNLEEMRETAKQLPNLDRRNLVARRRAELERFEGVQSPPALGTPPPGPPPDNPLNRTMMKFFGGPPQPSGEPGVLRGNPGSPGVVQGRARVLRSLSETDGLQEGEVLVAETTAPAWTPLFATAAAVVTDTGGVLSHCAVVAREYRIPAVVGTGAATGTIRSGQTIEVDGDAGTVRILSENGS